MPKVVFVADAHLPRRPEAVERFLSYLEGTLEGCVGLYLLGDVFHYAVGLPPFRSDATEMLLDRLEQIHGRGLSVTYVGGNREYFLADMLAARRGIASYDDSLDDAPFSIRLHLAHGDAINAADRQYLRWRKLARSRAARWAASMIPRSVADRVADRLERSFRGTNAMHRIRFPEEECRRYAEKAVARGCRHVILGHFHLARTIPIQVEGHEGQLHIVPDWQSSQSHAELWADGRFVLDARSATHAPV